MPAMLLLRLIWLSTHCFVFQDDREMVVLLRCDIFFTYMYLLLELEICRLKSLRPHSACTYEPDKWFQDRTRDDWSRQTRHFPSRQFASTVERNVLASASCSQLVSESARGGCGLGGKRLAAHPRGARRYCSAGQGFSCPPQPMRQASCWVERAGLDTF